MRGLVVNRYGAQTNIHVATPADKNAFTQTFNKIKDIDICLTVPNLFFSLSISV